MVYQKKFNFFKCHTTFAQSVLNDKIFFKICSENFQIYLLIYNDLQYFVAVKLNKSLF